MRERFTPEVSADARLFKYLTASQKENETLLDFATRLSVLHDKAKPPQASATPAAAQLRLDAKYEELQPLFLRGLLDKNLARRVMDRSPSTFAEALKMASKLHANSKTFSDAESTSLAINAMGGHSGVKKGPKIDLKQLQYVQEGAGAPSRPVTPTNSAPNQAAAFGPPADATHFNQQPFYHQQPHGPRGNYRGGYSSHRGAPQGQFRPPFHGQARGAYQQAPSGRGFSYPPRGAYTQNQQQQLRATVPYTQCYFCGDPHHWANNCAKRAEYRNKFHNLN
jgi:hypothetical protein